MESNENYKKLFPANEIMAAILTEQMTDTQAKAFMLSPQDTIAQICIQDISAVEVNVIENDENTIHLGLPYYDSISGIASEKLQDEHLDQIAGGEIIISICIACGVAIGAFAGTTTTAMVAGGLVGGAIGVGIAAGTSAAVIGTTVKKKREKAGKK